MEILKLSFRSKCFDRTDFLSPVLEMPHNLRSLIIKLWKIFILQMSSLRFWPSTLNHHLLHLKFYKVSNIYAYSGRGTVVVPFIQEFPAMPNFLTWRVVSSNEFFPLTWHIDRYGNEGECLIYKNLVNTSQRMFCRSPGFQNFQHKG